MSTRSAPSLPNTASNIISPDQNTDIFGYITEDIGGLEEEITLLRWSAYVARRFKVKMDKKVPMSAIHEGLLALLWANRDPVRYRTAQEVEHDGKV